MPNAKFSAHAITFSDGATSYNGVSRTAPRFPTVTFPLTKFGYPLADGYEIDTDSALLRTQQSSGHTRQRRSYVHQASRVSVTYRLTLDSAKELVAWGYAYRNDWWRMRLVTGNDDSATPCAPVTAKLSSEMSVTRIPFTRFCEVSFTVDIHSLAGWQAKSKEATRTYRVPSPLAAEFSELHAERNITTYDVTWHLSPTELAKFLAYASYIGTNWFDMKMVSTNIECGNEKVRFITGIKQSLARPGVFAVTTRIETMPQSTLKI